MTNASQFRPDIEGLRAVAILLVLLYHAQLEWFGGGFLGVDVFFVISGFLITRALLKEVRLTGRLNLREFYARRIRRLLPASVLVLATTAIGVWSLLPVTMWRTFGGDVASAAAYVVNWRFAGRSVDYLAEDVVASPVQHFWSLAVEEQFYLIWPLVIILGIWLHKRFNRSIGSASAVVLIMLVTVPSLAWSIWLTSTMPARAFFVTTTRLWELAIGALIAIVPPLTVALPRLLMLGCRVLALGVIVVMSVVVDAASPWPGVLALGPTLATAALIWLGEGSAPRGPDLVARALSLYPMQRIGAWSYSLYLWHWPPLAILSARWGGLTTGQALWVTGLSMIPAWLSHRLVENPVRFSERLRASIRLSLGFGAGLSLFGVVAGVGVVFAVGFSPSATPAQAGSNRGAMAIEAGQTEAELLAALEETRSITPAPALATEDLPVGYTDECQVPHSETEPRFCEYGHANSDRHVAAVGDSKMLQYSTALIPIAERNGLLFTSITKSACELSLALSYRNGEPYTECQEWSGRVLDWIRAEQPDLVLVSQGYGASDDRRARSALVAGMLGAYEELVRAGTQLVVLIDHPHPGMTVYECVAENMDHLEACTFSRAGRITSGGRAAQLEVVEQGAHESIDLLDMICPTEQCLPVIGDVLVYRQGSHLTATYVETLTDELERRLRPYLP